MYGMGVTQPTLNTESLMSTTKEDLKNLFDNHETPLSPGLLEAMSEYIDKYGLDQWNEGCAVGYSDGYGDRDDQETLTS